MFASDQISIAKKSMRSHWRPESGRGGQPPFHRNEKRARPRRGEDPRAPDPAWGQKLLRM